MPGFRAIRPALADEPATTPLPTPARPTGADEPRPSPRGRRLMATVAVGRRGSIVTRATTDKGLLRAYLERDRLYAAYAICDLEEREFARTRWGVA